MVVRSGDQGFAKKDAGQSGSICQADWDESDCRGSMGKAEGQTGFQKDGYAGQNSGFARDWGSGGSGTVEGDGQEGEVVFDRMTSNVWHKNRGRHERCKVLLSTL